MITFRTSADVKDDRRVQIVLPPEVPTGQAELVVSVHPCGHMMVKQPRTSLADWSEQNAEHWGDRLRSASPSCS